MTEKDYGGSNNRSLKSLDNKSGGNTPKPNGKVNKTLQSNNVRMVFDDDYVNDLLKAGEIHKKLKAHALMIIKPGVPLITIANEIDDMIVKLGAKPAFPVNLSINEVAAHYTPTYNDETLAHGLLKVDIGIQVNGAIADSAFSLDLDDNPVNKKLIEASRNALKAAINASKFGVELRVVGRAINNEITKLGFTPIINLCGHQIDRFVVHAGQTVPNYDNNDTSKMLQSGYAIEPFATTGKGSVYEGAGSNIFRFLEKKPVRDSKAREILDFIISEYSTLPFASRWLVKKFGTRALTALRFLVNSGSVMEYAQLVEKNKENVSQSENTIIVFNDGRTIITTEDYLK